MNIGLASLNLTRELLKRIWVKFVEDNKNNKEICDLFTRWCEKIDEDLEGSIKSGQIK